MDQLDRMRSLEQIKMFLHVSQTPPASIRINSTPTPTLFHRPLSRRRLWNVLNLQSEAEVCHSDSLPIVSVPVCSSQIDPVCHVSMSVPVCPRLCVVLSVSLSMLLSVSGSFALTMSAFPFCLCCCCCPLLPFELLLFASVSEARSSRSFAALQAHLHLHIVLVPPGKGRETLPSIANRLRIEMENAPNYKSKLTSGPYLCL